MGVGQNKTVSWGRNGDAVEAEEEGGVCRGIAPEAAADGDVGSSGGVGVGEGGVVGVDLDCGGVAIRGVDVSFFGLHACERCEGAYLTWVALRVTVKPVTEALVALCWRATSSCSAWMGEAQAEEARRAMAPTKVLVSCILDVLVRRLGGCLVFCCFLG